MKLYTEYRNGKFKQLHSEINTLAVDKVGKTNKAKKIIKTANDTESVYNEFENVLKSEKRNKRSEARKASRQRKRK